MLIFLRTMRLNNTGQLLKQIGQQQALFGAGELWLSHAKAEFRAWISALYKAGRREFRMEEFRAYCERIDLMPESPNAWGIFPSLFVKSGLIDSQHRAIRESFISAHESASCADLADCMKTILNYLSDYLLELRITLASRRAINSTQNWQHFIGLIKRRTSSSIARIERRKGLL